jgi:hypothetical protein
MLTRSSIFKSISAVALIGVLSFSAFADTIRLKDGSIIKGKITGFSGGRFTIMIGEGQRRRELVFTADEVESISFDNPVRTASTTKILSDDDVVPSKPAPKLIVTDTTGGNRSSEPPRQTGSTAPRKQQPVKTSEPAANPPVVNASTAKPIELNVKVLADNTANGWTNSGWVVKKGQRIRISGDGKVNLGGGRTSEPGGSEDAEDQAKLLRYVPTGALIAVIGDDNNDFIYIGTSREFVAERDGSLFLGINEGNLNDNSGSYYVKIEVIP